MPHELALAFGQAGYFLKQAPAPTPDAIACFSREAKHKLQLLDDVPKTRAFAAGSAYSIADIAHFGWAWRRDFLALSLRDTPHAKHWYAAVSARPAI